MIRLLLILVALILASTGFGATLARAQVVAVCDKPTTPTVQDASSLSVTVNPSTAWQPRGGELLIELRANAAKLSGLFFKACLGWSRPGTNEVTTWFDADVVVRPSQVAGVVNLGITVPDLDGAPTNVFDRWTSNVRSNGLGLIPVADLRLIAYSNTQVLFDGNRYIGVTNTPLALLVAVATLAIAVLCLHGFASAPGSAPAGRSLLQKLMLSLRVLLSFDWVLSLVRTPEGRASLSAFQILLWTVVVAVSAMYVMTLSGNLINLTPGTLTLLGIAGAAGLMAAYGDSNVKTEKIQGQPQGTDVPPQVEHTKPAWRDLIIDPKTGQPDIGRTQMLFFTVVSAVFVVMQVLNYYVVPDIPAGYQILMGISNGVYVGRKFAT